MRDQDELAHFLKTIELDAVRAQIAARAASEPGRALARDLVPLEDRAAIEEALARTKDAFERTLPRAAEPLVDLSQVVAVGTIFDRAAGSKRPLDPRELSLLARTARAGEKAHATPLGSALGKLTVPVDPAFADRVEAVLDPESYEVKEELLRDLREARKGARAALEEALIAVAIEHPGASVVEREGRLCVASRQPIPGLLVGRDGALGYFEPDAARDLANRAFEIELEETARSERLIAELDALARAHETLLRDVGARLARIDLHLALGRLARDLDMRAPEIVETGSLRLEAVRHPVLAERPGCVPIDLDLQAVRLLVISGPNGGGKTVALKTAGLACVLALAGSFVPAKAARIPLYGELLAAAVAPDDLAHGLSTFEVHARRLAAVASRVNERSFTLLDELGLGTDPVEGAALGRALLEFMLARGRTVLATTHLGPIKTFAASTEGAAIASVEVDAKGRPLYRLTVGKTGQSSALEVARRSGIPPAIVARAEELVRGR